MRGPEDLCLNVSNRKPGRNGSEREVKWGIREERRKKTSGLRGKDHQSGASFGSELEPPDASAREGWSITSSLQNLDVAAIGRELVLCSLAPLSQVEAASPVQGTAVHPHASSVSRKSCQEALTSLSDCTFLTQRPELWQILLTRQREHIWGARCHFQKHGRRLLQAWVRPERLKLVGGGRASRENVSALRGMRVPKHSFFMRWTRHIPSIVFFWSTQPTGRSSSSSTLSTSAQAEALADFVSFVIEDLHQDNVVMDERLWSNLPADLVEKVVARLPIPALFRMRAVCRRWNRLIFSGGFLALRKDAPPSAPWFLLCTSGGAMPVYNPGVEKWHSLPVPEASSGMSVIAASGGLICFGDQIRDCSYLIVCNPLTKAMRRLPCMPRVRLIHKVAMLADPSSKGYQILVVGEHAMDLDQAAQNHVYNLVAEVYDSSTNSWSTGGVPLQSAKFGTDPGAWVNGVVYCITELPYGVVFYDLKLSVWRDLPAPMPAHLVCPSLVECGGRLLMVAKALDPAFQLPRVEGIVIWEHMEHQREWVEVTRVPRMICAQFFEGLAYYRTQFVCAVLGSVLCVTTHLSPHCLTYDLDKRLWKWLPRDPMFPGLRDLHLTGFSVEPRLDSSP